MELRILDLLLFIAGWLLGVGSMICGAAICRRENKPPEAPAQKERMDRQWEHLMSYSGRDQSMEERYEAED